MFNFDQIVQILGNLAEPLLNYKCSAIPKELLHLPSPNSIQEIFSISDRSEKVISNLKRLYNHGRLGGTGYINILPVDQGIEHTAGEAFSKNIAYFDPENIVKLAIEAGCSGIASTLGILGMVSEKYADKIPFIVKINHKEMLTYPNSDDQILFADVEQAYNLGAVGIGATIYFGSQQSRRQIQEISKAFYQAHKLGMFTILWCYLRNPEFKKDGKDFHFSADLTGQANYLGVTIEADIIKQKLPLINGGFKQLNFGKYNDEMYEKLTTEHPIDLCRYQVANNFMGRIGLISSGGASLNDHKKDLQQAVISAVINKRAGGVGLILGRKAFQKPLEQGIEILKAVQDVYLCKEIDIA